MKGVLFTVLICCAVCLCAQKKEKTVREYMPTDNLEAKKDANRASNAPERKRIALLYVGDANKILYGNPCATKETHRMGFEYIVEPKNGRESKTRKGKFLNNLWVKTKLVVTRSPFWKLILNKRLDACRRQTGDFVG